MSLLTLNRGVPVYGGAIVACGNRSLQACRGGNEQTLQKLMPLLYEQLRAAARRYMAEERPNILSRLLDVLNIRCHNRPNSSQVVRNPCAGFSSLARSRDYQKRGQARLT
jgi:hypothetical protein